MNNTITCDHQDLFIYLNINYPRSHHDVNILQHSNIYNYWHEHFTHGDDYFEYLLRDLGYVGKEMFIMHWIGHR
jgi:hypothetical protein